jgi:hypothetical protein
VRTPALHAFNWNGEKGTVSSLVNGELLPHLVVFVVCFCILAGALILSPADSGRPHVRLGRVSIPNVCTFKNLTGLPCPGCGLVRSMVAAMHGDAVMSLSYHRLGLLTLVYIFFQFVYRLAVLLIPARRSRLVHYGKFLNQGVIILGILFGLNWITTLLHIRFSFIL